MAFMISSNRGTTRDAYPATSSPYAQYRSILNKKTYAGSS
jgi:hypothetical protein